MTAGRFAPSPSGDLLGISLTLAAVLACASYTVLTQKFLLDDASATVVLFQQVAALTFALVVTGVAGLRHVPAATAGAFLPLVPVFGVGAAYVTGERLLGQQWLGASLIVVAALVVVYMPARHAPTVASAAPQEL